MAEYLIRGGTLTAIAEAIRTKTGKADPISVSDMPAEIAGITTGGGSSEDVCYVTFMSHDGTVEYGKKAVAVGDDCADPIARGIFDTPARESDVQYDYTFYGWATTPGGAADPDWYKSVTEDKTLYANYISAVRYYTITYYDGDTVLKTQSLAYGSTPAYAGQKDGYNFEGWEPALATVTGDASYYAQWSLAITFAGASWADIAEISASGAAASTFAVGDEKVIPLTLADGTTESITVMIAGFDHDDLADGSGKAGISIVCKTLPTYTTLWGPNGGEALYHKSLVNTALQENGDIWNMLPTELTSVIKTVNKLYLTGYNASSSAATLSAPLWALSIREFGFVNTAWDTKLGTRYAVYDELSASGLSTLAQTSFKYIATQDGANTLAWVRSMYTAGTCQPLYIVSSQNTSGSITYASLNRATNLTTGSLRICFGFCI